MDDIPKIKKLDDNVVNRIAAGEIIQRPANALKELIENSLDAKSTSIQITVQDGGLKMMQIQDNGTGIRKEDLEIVCERFTTSKLQKFEDLQSISTYGFRGEALASISHVAHLTITTKTADNKVAYKASYIDSQLKGPPKPLAGNQGTTILIENLFYNVTTRRKALTNLSEEFTKITDVVTRYAIHNPNVGFILRKHREVIPYVRTQHNSTKINNIKTLFGDAVARDILDIKFEDKSYKFNIHALITNPNYSNKRMTFLLFINHRLVESTPIKRMLDDLYTIYLPKKTHPWCYVSLEIDPINVDVNVHPTKCEVRFLHEDIIIEKIKLALDEKLSSNSASRTFYLQARLPQVDVTENVLAELLPEYDKVKDNNSVTKKISAKEMIRTDAKEQKLDQFDFKIHVTKPNDEVKKKSEPIVTIETDKNEKNNTNDMENSNQLVNTENVICSTQVEKLKSTNRSLFSLGVAELFSTDEESSTELPPVKNLNSTVADRALKTVAQLFGSQNESHSSKSDKNNVKDNINSTKKTSSIVNEDEEISSTIDQEPKDKSHSVPQFTSYTINNFRREVNLSSILSLRKAVEDKYHEGLRKILTEMTFIGCVDEKRALIQSDVDLYICNTKKLAEELFYEIMLYDFSNYGILLFSEKLPLDELIMLALENKEAQWSEKDGPKETIAQNIKELYINHAEMLKEYFSILIDKQGNLKALPVLLDKYFPSEIELPMYILRMAKDVEWSIEKECFDGISRETAKFFSHIDPNSSSYDWKHLTEHVIYPAIKESLLPPKHFAHDSTILKIASLPNLYRVFERC
ncbi:hypothetical protein PV326_009886 [Microctonus aethiopoides]|nr:hypothetical protein PV326_009886 [Microctonus aethiopoides]